MKHTIGIFLLLFATLAQAQNAKSLLNEVSAKVKGYENISMDFKYNYSQPSKNINQETRGDVTLQGNKYVLNMLGTTRIFDGKKIYNIIPEDEEVTISVYNPTNDDEITPSKLLTFFEKGYVAKMDIVQNEKGRKIQFIKLTPTNPKADIKEILLGIDVQTKHISKMVKTDKDGATSTLSLYSFKTDQPLSKTLFVFDEAKYKKDGYYINKL